ncbi:MAG: hypothetical protein GY771_06345 [bacterium]|nr:hypothetical protein [bacterium]
MKAGVTITFLLVAVLAITGPAFGDGWQIEAVDTAGDGGYYTSIALDSGDNPHISYSYENEYYNFDDLKYAYYDGSSWQTEVVDTTADWEYEQYDTSIALDSGDNPHISYFDDSNSDLRYAYYDGSSWQFDAVDTAGYEGVYTSIALDSGDNPHISYFDYINLDLKYAYYDGSSWQTEAVDTAGSGGGYISITLDSGDNPHISYYDGSNADLKYAYYDGSSWQTEAVDTTGDVGRYTSIALDSGDNPHISYCDFTRNRMKYAYYDGSSWQIAGVATEGHVGWWTSIALDSGDNPHISHCDFTNHDLEYTYYDGSSWQFEVVDTAGNVGRYTSIALDSGDNPHISYYDSSNADLKYAKRYTAPADFDLLSPGDGDTVYEPVTLDWEDAEDTQEITYDVRYSTGPTFVTYDEITGLTDSTYTFGLGDLDDLTDYYWKVRAWDGYEETWSGPDDYWSFTVDNSTDIEDDEGNLPKTFALHPAVPNPSDGTTSICFALPRACNVELTLYDVKGRKIMTLAEGTYQPGEYSATASGLSSGIYRDEMNAGEFSDSKKMVVR